MTSRTLALTTRRGLMRQAVIVPLAAGLVSPFDALAALTATARQPLGPFYPPAFSKSPDNDLTRAPERNGQANGRANGRVLHLSGQLLNPDGQPLSGAVVQIWQADSGGRYRHPNARGSELLDPNFQGFGWTMTDDEGRYRFVTIRPAPYPGRTPHIHFAAGFPGGTPLVTQMYFPDEPLNRRDGLLNSVRDPQQRAALIAELDEEAGGLAARFDLVLPGKPPA